MKSREEVIEMNIIFEMNDDEINTLIEDFEIDDEEELQEALTVEMEKSYEEYPFPISVQVRKI